LNYFFPILLCFSQRHCQNIVVLTKYEENASQHPDLYSSEPFSLGRVGGDIVEDVDQHQEESDEEGHAPCTHHTVGMGNFRYHKVPGTMSGGIRNEIHETATNNPDGR
jgi:hypothetical protein